MPAAEPRRFLKHASAGNLPRLNAEAEGLRTLGIANAVRLPHVFNCGLVDGQAQLEVEYLELRPLDKASGALLGVQLAALHRHSARQFGFATDNFIGDSPQHNGWHHEWPLFFAQRRLQPQLEWAAHRGMEKALVDRGYTLAEQLAAFFLDHSPHPSLLHGDLWGGNAGALPDGTPVIFDPAVYYGDRETDLAMSELFGGFPESFYAAYRNAWPLNDGHETRKVLYNLYHVLNHFNVFGAAYLGQARRMIDRLRAEIRG